MIELKACLGYHHPLSLPHEDIHPITFADLSFKEQFKKLWSFLSIGFIYLTY